MKKTIGATILLVFLLAACGQVKADVPDNTEARTAQALVELYMDANLTYDADALVALYSEDLIFMDYGGNDGPLNKGNLDYFIHETMADKTFKYKFLSYLVTPDGRFAVLQAIYSQPAALSNKWASVSCVCVLEFRDGLIVNETWYYNGEKLH